jgi:hypothetical protein
MPRGFITSSTTSVDETPIWSPKLPPSMRTAPGAPQPVPDCLRHSTNPRPYFPPRTNAAFFTPGTSTMQVAFCSRSCGMERSGVAMISVNNVAASFSRSCVDSASAAPAPRESVISIASVRMLIW